jgi:hypothetical protein
VRPRAAFAVVCVFLAVFAAAAPAFAADSASDPRDTGGRVDIKQASDRVEGADVVYRIQTYESFDDVKDFYLMRWRFDLHNTGHPGDMCIQAEQTGDGGIQAELYPKCGPAVFATTPVAKPAGNAIEFRFPIETLVQCCDVVPGATSSYGVWSLDMLGHRDVVPDEGWITQSGLPAPARSAAGSHEGVGGSYQNELAASGLHATENGAALSGATIGSARRHGLPVAWIAIGLLLAVLAAGVAMLLRGRLVWVDAERSDLIDAMRSDQPATPSFESSDQHVHAPDT